MDLIFPYLNTFALSKDVSLMYLCIALLIDNAQAKKIYVNSYFTTFSKSHQFV